jgi:hypothetical protein
LKPCTEDITITKSVDVVTTPTACGIETLIDCREFEKGLQQVAITPTACGMRRRV